MPETRYGGPLRCDKCGGTPPGSVVTSVSIDHTAFLGHTAGEIAVHKAGIIKPGCPAVYDDSCPEAEAVILETAEKKGSPAFPVGCVPFRLGGGNAGIPVGLPGKDRGIYRGLSGPLPGRERSPGGDGPFCVRSWDPGRSRAPGLKERQMAARMERLLPGVYLDGAHNAVPDPGLSGGGLL